MKQLVLSLILVLGAISQIQGQDLKFKENFDARSSSTYRFETASFTGSFKASNTELTLKLKNSSRKRLKTADLTIELKDITGRGMELCHDEAESKFAPGDKLTLELHNCKALKGLFFLDPEYSSKAMFEEDAFFLKNKQWYLIINGEKVTFLTEV